MNFAKSSKMFEKSFKELAYLKRGHSKTVINSWTYWMANNVHYRKKNIKSAKQLYWKIDQQNTFWQIFWIYEMRRVLAHPGFKNIKFIEKQCRISMAKENWAVWLKSWSIDCFRPDIFNWGHHSSIVFFWLLFLFCFKLGFELSNSKALQEK